MLIAAIVAAIAVAAGVAAGGGGDAYGQIYSQWKKGLKKHVKDKELRARAQAILERFKQQSVELNRTVAADVQALAEVNRRYESTVDDYAALIDALGTHVYTGQETMLSNAVDLHAAIGAGAYSKIRDGIRKDTDKYEKKKTKREARERRKAERKGAAD